MSALEHDIETMAVCAADIFLAANLDLAERGVSDAEMMMAMEKSADLMADLFRRDLPAYGVPADEVEGLVRKILGRAGDVLMQRAARLGQDLKNWNAEGSA